MVVIRSLDIACGTYKKHIDKAFQLEFFLQFLLRRQWWVDSKIDTYSPGDKTLYYPTMVHVIFPSMDDHNQNRRNQGRVNQQYPPLKLGARVLNKNILQILSANSASSSALPVNLCKYFYTCHRNQHSVLIVTWLGTAKISMQLHHK